MIRKSFLAKGLFSTKIFLAKGIRSKTGAAHPHQKFFRVPPGSGLYSIDTVATDPLALEHQAISIHSADKISCVLNQFHKKNTFMMNNIRK